MDLSSIVGLQYDRIIGAVGQAVDGLVTSDEERIALHNKLIEIQLKETKDRRQFEHALEKEVTVRWGIDKENLLTRAVRPTVVLWSLGLLTVAMLFDGNVGEFVLKESYLPIVETVVQTVIIAYFGSRGVEKVTSLRRKES